MLGNQLFVFCTSKKISVGIFHGKDNFMYDCMFSQDAKLHNRRTEQTQLKCVVILHPVS